MFLEFKDNKGNIPVKSGINQMHSQGNVCDYDAYIPIRKIVRDANNHIIPNNGTIVSVDWGNGDIMDMMFESSKTGEDGIAQQLASTPERKNLGKYLRKKMGLIDPNGNISKKLIDFNDFTTKNPGVELNLQNGQWSALFVY